MNLDYPTWLNEEFVKKVLRFSEKDESIEIISLHLSLATKPGDNYASLMFRTEVEFKRENNVPASKSMVVKVKPELDSDLLNIREMFETEASMMMDALSRMNQLLSDGSRLSAKAFYSQKENPVILVLEDLFPQGFRMIRHGTELDSEHSLLTIRNVAKFHATSFALGKENPSAIKKYNKGFYHADQKPGFWKYFERCIRDVSKNIATLPDFGPRFAEKISKLEPYAAKRAVEVSAYREGEFSVLCHGDLWTKNMLYRYDDHGKPIEHIFVDFQMPVYTSPAYDILYMFGTSIRDDSARESLLIEYHSTLKSTMSQLNCQTSTPTLVELKKALRERGFLDVVVTLLTLPIIIQVDEFKGLDAPDINDDDFDMPSLRSKVFLDILKRRMQRWNETGLLDIK